MKAIVPGATLAGSLPGAAAPRARGPEDQRAPLGRAIAWMLVMGAAITTARMIAIRYTSRLLPGGQQQGMTETAAAALAGNPGSSTA